jgi:hypothetical protein
MEIEKESMKTHRKRSLPPFFTQVIESLPRPSLLLNLLSVRSEMSTSRLVAHVDDATDGQ